LLWTNSPMKVFLPLFQELYVRQFGPERDLVIVESSSLDDDLAVDSIFKSEFPSFLAEKMNVQNVGELCVAFSALFRRTEFVWCEEMLFVA
jgi:hypothetical protein